MPDSSLQYIKEDASIFLKQSMSTPVLDEVIDAEGIYLELNSGKRLIDFHGNSLHQVGYKNPQVMHAIVKQMKKLPFIPRRFTNQIVVQAAHALNDKTKSKDYKVLFTPSGTAAVGIALKYARLFTGKHKVISMWESFHGASLDAIGVGGDSIFKQGMGALLPGGIRTLPYKSYRNIFNESNDVLLAQKCIEHIEYIIKNEGEIGAIILEPIRATDINIPPQSYFKALRMLCDENDILLIVDEIPTGLGRTGKFYAHQHFDFEPDIIVLGKGLGGGMIPQACTLIKEKFDLGSHISLGHYTHEKPSLGAAALLATLGYIDEEKLLENVQKNQPIINRYKEIVLNDFNCVGDIRSIGYLISFEIVKDRITKEKDELLAEKLMYSALNNGLSFKIGSGNCLTWHMPLITSDEEIIKAFEILIGVLKENI